jgi:hypothetical protein
MKYLNEYRDADPLLPAGTLYSPQRPVGATTVSAEGACGAYYAYGRHPQPIHALHQIALVAALGAMIHGG